MRRGRWLGDVDGHEVAIEPGQVCLFDLARPVDNWVSANASLRVMIPREQLDRLAPAGGAHGAAL